MPVDPSTQCQYWDRLAREVAALPITPYRQDLLRRRLAERDRWCALAAREDRRIARQFAREFVPAPSTVDLPIDPPPTPPPPPAPEPGATPGVAGYALGALAMVAIAVALARRR